jgi:hypothetical protein
MKREAHHFNGDVVHSMAGLWNVFKFRTHPMVKRAAAIAIAF